MSKDWKEKRQWVIQILMGRASRQREQPVLIPKVGTYGTHFRHNKRAKPVEEHVRG